LQLLGKKTFLRKWAVRRNFCLSLNSSKLMQKSRGFRSQRKYGDGCVILGGGQQHQCRTTPDISPPKMSCGSGLQQAKSAMDKEKLMRKLKAIGIEVLE